MDAHVKGKGYTSISKSMKQLNVVSLKNIRWQILLERKIVRDVKKNPQISDGCC